MKYVEVVKAVREEQMKKEASVKDLAGLLKKKAGMNKKAFGEKVLKEFAKPVSNYTRKNAEQYEGAAKQLFRQANQLWPQKVPYTDHIKAGTAAQIKANNIREDYKKELQDQMAKAKKAGQPYQQVADVLTPSRWKDLLVR